MTIGFGAFAFLSFAAPPSAASSSSGSTSETARAAAAAVQEEARRDMEDLTRKPNLSPPTAGLSNRGWYPPASVGGGMRLAPLVLAASLFAIPAPAVDPPRAAYDEMAVDLLRQ